VSTGADGAIIRDWYWTPNYRESLQRALDDFLSAIESITLDRQIFSDWRDMLDTGAHHSGACRMATDNSSGVCNSDLKVFGLENLYLCDGSVVPSSGFSNTGLIIGALAYRLSRHLQEDIQ
jgi:choline dehydrogenase-like flavoprotein